MKRLAVVELAAIITGVVALIGVGFTIYSLTANNLHVASAKVKQEVPKQNPSPAKPEARKEAEEDTPTDTGPLPHSTGLHEVKEEPKPEIKEVPKRQETLPQLAVSPSVAKPKEAAVKAGENRKKEESRNNKKIKKNLLKETKSERRLKQTEMALLLSKLNRSKARRANAVPCVVLRQSNKSNITQGMGDVARYLQSRGYIIAGRQKVDGKVQGLQVNPSGQCMTVTIGQL